MSDYEHTQRIPLRWTLMYVWGLGIGFLASHYAGFSWLGFFLALLASAAVLILMNEYEYLKEGHEEFMRVARGEPHPNMKEQASEEASSTISGINRCNVCGSFRSKNKQAPCSRCGARIR